MARTVNREPPRNGVILIPAGGNVKKRQAIIKLTGSSEIILARQRADGRTVGFKSGFGGFKTLNVEDLLAALTYITHSDDELEAMIGNQLDVPERKHVVRDDVDTRTGDPIPF